jgi:hypothetical protein
MNKFIYIIIIIKYEIVTRVHNLLDASKLQGKV